MTTGMLFPPPPKWYSSIMLAIIIIPCVGQFASLFATQVFLREDWLSNGSMVTRNIAFTLWMCTMLDGGFPSG